MQRCKRAAAGGYRRRRVERLVVGARSLGDVTVGCGEILWAVAAGVNAAVAFSRGQHGESESDSASTRWPARPWPQITYGTGFLLLHGHELSDITCSALGRIYIWGWGARRQRTRTV